MNKREKAEFESMQRQLQKIHFNDIQMTQAEMTDLRQVHEDLLKFKKPKQHGYKYREGKKAYTFTSNGKKLFKLPKIQEEWK